MIDTNWEQVDEKVRRRISQVGEEIMMVEYVFQKGGVGQPHKHDEHEQIGYIAGGSFEVVCGEEKTVLKQGDSYYAPKHTVHGVVALEDDSIIIDAFTPLRADLLK